MWTDRRDTTLRSASARLQRMNNPHNVQIVISDIQAMSPIGSGLVEGFGSVEVFKKCEHCKRFPSDCRVVVYMPFGATAGAIFTRIGVVCQLEALSMYFSQQLNRFVF